jgi:hypothetical protein
MTFERYIKPRFHRKPAVSIWKRGQVSFNKSAVEENEIDGYDYVVLFFNRETRKIGFLFTTNDKEAGAIRLNKRKNDVTFSAIGFLNYYKVEYRATKKYDISFDEENKLYTIKLEK